jgi:TolB-like protein
MSDGPLKRLLRETHRRSLWQVLGIYLLGSWAMLGGLDTLDGLLELPEWFQPLALGLIAIGLPLVLATAFLQKGGPGHHTEDATGDGPESDDEPAAERSFPLRLLTWRNALVGGLAAISFVGAIAIGGILFGGDPGTRGGAERGDIERSVAVLPFVNLSGDPGNDYFSDGITEELLNALVQIPGLRVPGRTSSFAFKGRNLTIQQIADTLDVAHVLEGSVRRSGETVVIIAQLVDARNDTQLWSETFERELDDIFAIQREIATAIVDQLQVTLSGAEQIQLVAQATESPEAHEAYLRGRDLWSQRTGASLRGAITEFQQAVDLDPSYAEAYSGLADAYLLVDFFGGGTQEQDRRANMAQGLEAARRAVALDPDLGMAYASLGWGLWNVGEWESAEQAYQRGIELNPGYASGHEWYGIFLYSTGRAIEGVIHAQEALELDPVSPIISSMLGQALLMAGRIEDAIEQFRETIALAPDWNLGWSDLAAALLEAGEYDEGLQATAENARLNNADPQVARDQYQAMIRYQETGEPQSITGFNAGLRVSLRTGNLDRAIAILGREGGAFRMGAYGSAARTHALERLADFLGDDPRYQALLEETGITW